jgi:guanylate kinase
MKGNLIIISSPSGGGKGTLIREVLLTVPEIGYSVSYTTRARRLDEIDGRNYHFVSAEEFQKRIDAGDFLEYAEVHGNMYGTSLSQVREITESGRDVILEIDVQGAAFVRERVPEAVSIFILPPSFDVLKARLTARGTEDPADLELRLGNSFGEVMEYKKFDYVVVNDLVPAASRSLAAIILAERHRLDRQNDAVCGILSSFEVSKKHRIGD